MHGLYSKPDDIIWTRSGMHSCRAARIAPCTLPMSGVSPCPGLENSKGIVAHHMLLYWDCCRVLWLPCNSDGQMCHALPQSCNSARIA